MEETPLVSIVITSFNRLDDLKESIRRTSDISYPNIEVIVIDGGSTDGSAEYVGNLDKEKYESLVLGVDEGAYITVAKGMRHAKGKYIITIDDDCFLRPSVVSKTVEIFESNSNLALIGYGLRNPKNGPDEKEYWKPTEFGVGDYNFSNSYQTMNYGSASAFRKSALVEVDYIDSNWSWSAGGGDNILNFQLISHEYNTVLIPELVAFHKVSAKSRNSDTFTENCINSVIWILLKYYPLGLLLRKLLKLFGNIIYFAILFRKPLYIKAVFRSAYKSSHMLSNKKRIKFDIAKDLHIPIVWLFSHDREKEVTA